MIWLIVILAGGIMLLLALIFSFVLGWANRALHVEVNPVIETINNILPGVNCGGCGYIGCNEYAEAVSRGDADINLCTVGGVNCAESIAGVMGIEYTETFPPKAFVHCGADDQERLLRYKYLGESTCAAANLVTGIQGCIYGCLGFGDCERACQFDAVHVVNGLAVVDYLKCTGCGACAKACPRNVIAIESVSADNLPTVACSSLDPLKVVKKVCGVGCIGCGICSKISDSFQVKDNLAFFDYSKDPLKNSEDIMKASEKCPRSIIKLISFHS